MGPGVLEEVGACVAAWGIRRPLVVSDQGVAGSGWTERVVTSLRSAGLEPAEWLVWHPDPSIDVVRQCRVAYAANQHDGLVAVGGGSVIDVAKACSGLAVHPGQLTDYEGLGRFTMPGPPVFAVLTTPGSGAELSQHAVIADGAGRRFAVSGRWLAPRMVLADPSTFTTLPPEVATDTVLDAMLHAIEAYLGRAASPYTDMCARMGLGILGAAAVPAIRDGDPAANLDLVSGCLAAGIAMANASAGVVHALGYPLTSEYQLSHGRANALVAPAALRAVAHAAPVRYAELGRLLTPDTGASDLAASYTAMRVQLGVTASLADYGVPYADLARLAALAIEYRPVLRNTRREFSQAELCDLYQLAWKGQG
ncbi:MAG TPA: iron-containing alcohol dehydrogenase [Jatrophihabitans sp.]|uniref:iron-containing alcohol dehydrogenase family protein n=1 Tax=Jatrophihabitans sp. TaxID=1932789 RepID=UPI002EEA213B